MLHWMSMGFIAIALTLILFAFFTVVMRVEKNSPQTGLFTVQNQITGAALAGGQDSAQKTQECISDPRKCVAGQTASNETPLNQSASSGPLKVE